MSLLELTATGIGPVDPLEISFGERLNLITGDNGLGKSLILDLAFWQMTGCWCNPEPLVPTGEARVASVTLLGSKEIARSVQFQKKRQRWVWQPTGTHKTGLAIFARANGSFATWDPARNFGVSTNTLNNTEERPQAFLFDSKEVWNGLPGNGSPIVSQCNGLIRDWVAWQRQSQPQFDLLCKVLTALSPDSDVALVPAQPIRMIGNAQELPALATAYGDIPLTHASEAVRRVVALAYLLVWTWTEHQIEARLRGWPEPIRNVDLMIDELEAHLHPRWQRRILPALLEAVGQISSEASVQIIAVTHAPLLLASIETRFNANIDRLFTVDLVSQANLRKRAVLLPQDFQKRGNAARWLSSEAFDETPSVSIEAQEAIARASQWLTDSNHSPEDAAAIEFELGQALGESDPFWPRWLYHKQQLIAHDSGSTST